MKEADFQRRVTDMAVRFGWRWWHVPAPMRWTAKGWVPAKEAAGLPDLVLMHEDPDLLIIAELKGDGGKLSDEQTDFLRMARNVAGEQVGVYAWSPPDEEIVERILRSKVLI